MAAVVREALGLKRDSRTLPEWPRSISTHAHMQTHKTERI